MILVRAIKPAKPLQSSIFRDEVRKEMKPLSQEILHDFERTTATWKHKPKFKVTIQDIGTQSITIQVTTKDKIYGYVDLGTRPHIIKAKTKRGLLFKAGSQPKTEPKVIMSTPGKEGTDWKNPNQVKHPGTKAREFTKTIAKSYEKEFRQRIKQALDRAARRMNKT